MKSFDIDTGKFECGLLRIGLPEFADELRVFVRCLKDSKLGAESSSENDLVFHHDYTDREYVELLYHRQISRDLIGCKASDATLTHSIPGQIENVELLIEQFVAQKGAPTFKARWRVDEGSFDVGAIHTGKKRFQVKTSWFSRSGIDTGYDVARELEPRFRAFCELTGIPKSELESARNANESLVKVGTVNFKFKDSVLLSVWHRDLEFDRTEVLVRDAISQQIELFGEPSDVSLLRWHLAPTTEDAIWSNQNIKLVPQEDFDSIRTSQCPKRIVAIPVLRVVRAVDLHNADFRFQINVVHVDGAPLVEVQAHDRKWLDCVANFFDAPIDLWEGPVEARFGWYGDESLGKTIKYQSNESNWLPRPKDLKSVYAVFPKVLWSTRGTKMEEKKRLYCEPVAVFETAEEADSFARENASMLMHGDLREYTTMLVGSKFDLENYSPDVQNRVCNLLEIELTNWRETFDRATTLVDDDARQELIKILDVRPYRILNSIMKREEYQEFSSLLNKPEELCSKEDWVGSLFNLDVLSDDDELDDW